MTTFCGFKLVHIVYFCFGYKNNLENYFWTQYFQVSFLCPCDEELGGILIYPLSVRSSVRKQIHGLSGYFLLQFWSYNFNILQDVYTHNGGVHVHRSLILIKYSQNDRQLDLVICSFVRIQIHGLSGYLLVQFQSYIFNVLQDVYTQNRDVHVYRIFMVRRGHHLCLTYTLHFFLYHS